MYPALRIVVLFEALFVDLGSKNVLKNVRALIKKRASDGLGDESRPGWRQLLIFPEGTTTNGRSLIKFKTGAFEVNKINKRWRNYSFMGSIPNFNYTR